MNHHSGAVNQVDFTFFYIAGISLAILTLVTFLMIFFVVKYRRSHHPVAADIRGNFWLEIIWTIIPTIIAFSMFYYGWISYQGLRNPPPGAYTIKVMAKMFDYEFTYPDGRISYEGMGVPVGKAIRLILESKDVIHGFYLPAFRIKTDVVPGLRTTTWFQADKLGEYDIFCSEYCGIGHSEMRSKLKVLSEIEFEQWKNQFLEKPEEEEEE